MNKILFKVFGATSKDSYRYIYECFVIDIINTKILVNITVGVFGHGTKKSILFIVNSNDCLTEEFVGHVSTP